MPAVVFFRLVEARGGITVGASVKTGVVHPDVLADHAPTGFTLGGILRMIHLQSKDLPDLPVKTPYPVKSFAWAQLERAMPLSRATAAMNPINSPKAFSSRSITSIPF